MGGDPTAPDAMSLTASVPTADLYFGAQTTAPCTSATNLTDLCTFAPSLFGYVPVLPAAAAYDTDAFRLENCMALKCVKQFIITRTREEARGFYMYYVAALLVYVLTLMEAADFV